MANRIDDSEMSNKENYLMGKQNGKTPSTNGELVEPKRRRTESTDDLNGIKSKEKSSTFLDELSEYAVEVDQDVEKATKDQKWQRPALSPLNTEKDDIFFQQIDCEEFTEGPVPSIRLFGVTDHGNSILTHVTGFLPYFYIKAPVGFRAEMIEQFSRELDAVCNGGVIDHCTLEMKENLYGFQGNEKSPFIKIFITDPRLVSRARNVFERNEMNFEGLFPTSVITFESNTQYLMRFMIDCNVAGMSWLQLPAGKYQFRYQNCVSDCQIEAWIHYKDLISLPAEGEWLKMAPLRILSFDIECAGRKGIFPDASIDPVIQIANIVTQYGDKDPFVRNVFCVDTCSQIVGTHVFEFQSQSEMLLAWSKFVREVDPDVMIGYNISNFDFPYLLDRAKTLRVNDFPLIGRIKNYYTVAKDTTFSSKAYGTRESKSIQIPGRLQLDLLQVMQRDFKLRSYSLNAVCAQFLGEQKEDVHHSIITDLHNGTADSRRRLAIYCLKDAYLPQRLMDKLMCFVNYTEMARVTGVPFNYLLSRGQQVKVISQLFRKALQHDLVVPNIKVNGTDEQYEGATVIEPTKGYYDTPIATLDFSSLYPSIMQAHNLCYTTLLDPNTAKSLNLKPNEDYSITPNGDYFVKPQVRKGLLPIILADLLNARKRAKADLKNEKDPFKKAVLDGRQLALKVSANSVYGFTGATNGRLPCLAISSSVTSYGRQMIEKTKEVVEDHFRIQNGYSHDAVVIYGDTDSVMVKFGVKTLPEAMKLGEKAADFVSNHFIDPIKLEFEKVYFPYLLISKKRYAGLFWTRTDTFDKMDSKGIETVRRDNCPLVSYVIDTALRKMLIDQDVEGAQEFTKSVISDLLQNKVDMSQLVITKALSKTDYAAKQAHVELAERMRKRDAGSAPAIGDRVAYVIIKGARGDQFYMRSEDPIYVLENNIPIDAKYYLENQLSKPLLRIFEPILGEKASSLLHGDHTRTISVAAPSVGGIMKFAVKVETCLGCKAPIKKSKAALCDNCIDRSAELYQLQVGQVNDLEIRFARLWTQCQRCQGSMHQDVICSSRDCPIFYMRIAEYKKLKQSVDVLQRFDEMSW
ncbi:DNA polymerase delta catalytic subunit Cdc6 [Schizosaccharomyces octosporus yFS286]|uniref:DNA polymerase n=1 Tax=Schizosaccharomyces octosporus (strain yFS286) TaxID=483514 RepID=S9PTS2_SCHOY|nr:DNA polymerase delta catalytic subunit Cdc6 [Schizosaccharomyces octosporus yFS286]EPX72526.1 DNA polymerase delta catalytic subunit Cdc6 [Schizosaccharomyces octosporus yFS286]